MDKGNQSCTNVGCSECPLESDIRECLNGVVESVDIVEKWSQEHPKKTMLMDLLEKYPNTSLDNDGTPTTICPAHLGYEKDKYCQGMKETSCVYCWNREYE